MIIFWLLLTIFEWSVIFFETTDVTSEIGVAYNLINISKFNQFKLIQWNGL